MGDPGLLLSLVLLPLFPFSIVFNALLERLQHPLLRSLLLLAWPQAGLWTLSNHVAGVPDWFAYWALASSLLYAFRLVSMREMGRWTGFLGTSAWALLWLPLTTGTPAGELWISATAFSIPLVFLALLADTLETRFGAAYTGLYGGLAQSMPRFSGVLVLSVLAATATPLFPGFFAMLHALIESRPLPAVGLAGIWLVWSWAGARLLQGLIVGSADPVPDHDIGMISTWGYATGLIGLIVAGLILTGGHL